MEGYPDKNLDGLGDCRNFNLEREKSHDYRREETDKVSDDVLDLLPSDPFGMNISTFTAITGWLGDIEDFGRNTLGFGTDGIEVKKGDDRLYTGLNLVWNGTVKFHPEVGIASIDQKLNGSDEELRAGLYDGGFVLDGKIEEFMGFSYEKYWVSSDAANDFQECTKNFCDGNGPDGRAPHDALFFALDQPLSDEITDDALLHLTSRAQGTLQCLSLVGCLKVTDSGLRRVLENNPGLTKLSVPGCLRLSVEGILCSLKVLKSAGTPGIKHLRIGGLLGVTDTHYEELKFLLGVDNHKKLSSYKPRFYGGGQTYLSWNDDRAIDLETCPICQRLTQVYDCPAESCQGKHQAAQLCRACKLCIARCIHCGRCINDDCDYEETFCLDMLCLDCLKQLLSWEKKQEEMCIPSSKHTIFHQQARYRFCLYG
ncbi:hypothetical protein F0562_004549 [Nyssa sinensis]|uniref:F-box protein SKIP14 n=1 Tax=Nyssa sinensis TaxID=561372 RepID=A0A5J5C225_9ASTE|nr:hypothetical protein F0562_004549 [Nyssa sinensis]